LKFSEKNLEKKAPRISPLAIAALNSDVGKCKTILKIGKLVAEEYLGNKDFYDDMVRFNCLNGIKPVETKRTEVCYNQPPPEALDVIHQVYARFKGLDYSDIFIRLGISKTAANRLCPVEVKWERAYIRKFGTREYSKQNRVTVGDIMS
jgi:hypothetical protein